MPRRAAALPRLRGSATQLPQSRPSSSVSVSGRVNGVQRVGRALTATHPPASPTSCSCSSASSSSSSASESSSAAPSSSAILPVSARLVAPAPLLTITAGVGAGDQVRAVGAELPTESTSFCSTSHGSVVRTATGPLSLADASTTRPAPSQQQEEHHALDAWVQSGLANLINVAQAHRVAEWGSARDIAQRLVSANVMPDQSTTARPKRSTKRRSELTDFLESQKRHRPDGF